MKKILMLSACALVAFSATSTEALFDNLRNKVGQVVKPQGVYQSGGTMSLGDAAGMQKGMIVGAGNQLIVDPAKQMGSAVKGAATGVAGVFKGLGSGIFQGVKTTAVQIGSGVKGAATGAVGGVVTTAKGIGTAVKDGAVQTGQGIATGGKNVLTAPMVGMSQGMQRMMPQPAA